MWVKRGRRVYMWGNEGEEGVRVGEEGRRVYVWVNEGEEGVRVGE